jgi:hypothetical protein
MASIRKRKDRPDTMPRSRTTRRPRILAPRDPKYRTRDRVVHYLVLEPQPRLAMGYAPPRVRIMDCLALKCGAEEGKSVDMFYRTRSLDAVTCKTCRQRSMRPKTS